MEPSSVVYYCSQQYVQLCSRFEREYLRAAMVHGLINAYHLFDKLTVLAPKMATMSELRCFHSTDYVDFLFKMNKQDEVSLAKMHPEIHEFGFNYDCPVRPGIFDYTRLVAGASVDAAHQVAHSAARVAINWGGGWHHARRSDAAGFCYVNDCVLAVLELRKTFTRVLYIDIDCHHGDAVQDAFYGSDKVFTLSIHRQEPGYFPGTGVIQEKGKGKGENCCLNVPVGEGLTDEQFYKIIRSIFPRIHGWFKPEAVVMQCGADALSGDPIGGLNLTPVAYKFALQTVLDWNLPTVLLGGGGYHSANTARCWAQLTALCLGADPLPNDIPEHAFFGQYGPSFELDLKASMLRNGNTDASIQASLDFVEALYDHNCLMESEIPVD